MCMHIFVGVFFFRRSTFYLLAEAVVPFSITRILVIHTYTYATLAVPMTSPVHAHSVMVHKMKLTAMEHRFVTSGKDDGDKFRWLSVQVKWEVNSHTQRILVRAHNAHRPSEKVARAQKRRRRRRRWSVHEKFLPSTGNKHKRRTSSAQVYVNRYREQTNQKTE